MKFGIVTGEVYYLVHKKEGEFVKNIGDKEGYWEQLDPNGSRDKLSHIAIVGVGNVGSTLAYSLMLSGVVRKLTLIDSNKNQADGQAIDLRHCMQFVPFVDIVAGCSFSLLEEASIVIITAGIAQQPGQTRLDLLFENKKLYEKIIPQIIAVNSSCIIIVVTNPVDALTFITQKISGLSPSKVFGSGTVLDTARLRYLIGCRLQVSPKDISAYVLGEHGDSGFVWWSRASIGGVALRAFPYPKTFEEEVLKQTRSSAYDIIQKKGSTYFAIALAVCKIVKAIILNQQRLFAVSTYFNDVALSIPTIIRREGACQTLDLELDAKETRELEKSRLIIKEALDKVLL